jgi:hypothetical protein
VIELRIFSSVRFVRNLSVPGSPLRPRFDGSPFMTSSNNDFFMIDLKLTELSRNFRVLENNESSADYVRH